MSDDSSDDESMGSLKDFIVEDSEAESDLEEPSTKKQKVEEPIALLANEASQFVGSLDATCVNGRTLRSRDKLTKPKDDYYERFGKKAEAELLEKFTKKDIIEFVKDLEKEHKASYEASGKEWPKLTTKMSLDSIRESYDDIKAFAGLPDSDAEDDSEAEDESEDESVEPEEDDTEEEASDDEESDDEESDDEDASDDEESDDEDEADK
jgi:hypothetical protein